MSVVIACPDCGAVLESPSLQPGTAAVCPTCQHLMERTRGRSVNASLCFALATFILLFPALLEPLLSVSIGGMSRVSHLGSGIAILWEHQWVIVATLVAAFVIAFPLLRFGLLAVVLAAVQCGRRSAIWARLYRYSLQLDLWAMPDVFLLGALVGYSRVSANLPVHVEAGGLCLLLACACAMLARATLDRRSVWRAFSPASAVERDTGQLISCLSCDLALPCSFEGDHCPRCAAVLRARKPSSLTRTLALVVAGCALYIPANVFPMSSDVQLGKQMHHRIIDGIAELFNAGLWPLGALIFCTSIAIPLLKLVGLGWLLLSVRQRSNSARVFKTKLYRAISELGRWSNVDVFTIAVFLPLINFAPLASTHADLGATAFILVVVLTMLAVRTFDPRQLWDT